MCEQGDVEKVVIVKGEHGSCGFVNVDKCIAPIVRALNRSRVFTVASCCGHGKVRGNIALADGRMLDIFPDFESWEKAEQKGERCLLD